MKQNRIFFCLLIVFCGCASEPQHSDPDWIHQSTRQVDNGYIVYVGTATANNQERAQFRAEGLALEDIANECSVIAKGTRVEDRYNVKEKHEVTSYVKVALEFQECEAAKKALDPEEIRKIASEPFTEQLKKYQDLNDTGEMPESGRVASIEPPETPTPAPDRDPHWNDSTHFFVTRQYIAYQKEIVVLAPPAAYAPGTPQTQNFVNTVRVPAQQVASIEATQPALRTQAWSNQPNRPTLPRPISLAPAARMSHAHSVVPPVVNGAHPNARKAAPKAGGGGRRRRRPSSETK